MNTPLSLGDMFFNTITNPTSVFDSIKLKNSFMIPLTLSLSLSLVIIYWYFQQVDPVWFVDHMISLSEEDLAPDQVETMEKIFKPQNMQYFSIFGVVIGGIVAFLLQSLYLLIVGNTKNIDVSFGEWFSLTTWSSVPAILLAIMILLNMAIGDNSQLAMELINPINFASLLGLEGPGKTYNVLAGMSLVTFWGLYLVAAGYKHWSKDSWVVSILIVAVPYVLFWLAQIYLF